MTDQRMTRPARAALASAVAVLALAGCGGKSELQPAPGQSLPPAPFAAEVQPTPSELITPSVQARPQRSDELLRRSEERREDRFNLPPG